MLLLCMRYKKSNQKISPKSEASLLLSYTGGTLLQKTGIFALPHEMGHYAANDVYCRLTGTERVNSFIQTDFMDNLKNFIGDCSKFDFKNIGPDFFRLITGHDTNQDNNGGFAHSVYMVGPSGSLGDPKTPVSYDPQMHDLVTTGAGPLAIMFINSALFSYGFKKLFKDREFFKGGVSLGLAFEEVGNAVCYASNTNPNGDYARIATALSVPQSVISDIQLAVYATVIATSFVASAYSGLKSHALERLDDGLSNDWITSDDVYSSIAIQLDKSHRFKKKLKKFKASIRDDLLKRAIKLDKWCVSDDERVEVMGVVKKYVDVNLSSVSNILKFSREYGFSNGLDERLYSFLNHQFEKKAIPVYKSLKAKIKQRSEEYFEPVSSYFKSLSGESCSKQTRKSREQYAKAPSEFVDRLYEWGIYTHSYGELHSIKNLSKDGKKFLKYTADVLGVPQNQAYRLGQLVVLGEDPVKVLSGYAKLQKGKNQDLVKQQSLPTNAYTGPAPVGNCLV